MSDALLGFTQSLVLLYACVIHVFVTVEKNRPQRFTLADMEIVITLSHACEKLIY